MLDFLTMFWKELIQVSNRGRFSVQKMLTGGLVCFIFILMAYDRVYSHSNATFQNMARFGREFVMVLVAVLTVLLSLAALVFASGVVVAEKVRHRLALLLVTPLGASAIVGSKAAGVYTRVLGGLLIALPAVAMLQVFGGVDRSGILHGVAFIVSNVWLYGAIGLLASVAVRTAPGAIVFAFVLALCWNLLPLFYALLLEYLRSSANPSWSGGVVFSASPFIAFFQYAGSLPIPGASVLFHVCLNAVVGAVILAIAFLLFRPTARRLVSGAPGRADMRRARKASSPRPRRSPFLRFAEWIDDAVMAKEMLHWRPWRSLLPLGWFALIWGIVILVSLAFGEAPDLADDSFHWPLFLFEAVGFFFILSLMAATRVAGEREARTLQVLLMTRLTALRVILGKAGSLLIEQSLPILILAAHLALLMRIDVPDLGSATVKLLGFLVTVAFCAMFGVYFSLAAKTAAHAVVVTAGAWFLGVVAAWFPVILVLESLGDFGSGSEWTGLLAVIFTLCALLSILAVLIRGRRRGHGLVLAFVAYSTIAAALVFCVAAAVSSSMGDDDLVAAAMLLPASSLLPWDWNIQSISVPLLVLPVQAALLVWMSVASVFTFEAQARREHLNQ